MAFVVRCKLLWDLIVTWILLVFMLVDYSGFKMLRFFSRDSHTNCLFNIFSVSFLIMDNDVCGVSLYECIYTYMPRSNTSIYSQVQSNGAIINRVLAYHLGTQPPKIIV